MVRTGWAIGSCLYPKKLPRKTNGTETQNHKKSSVKNDENGNALDDPSTHKTRFRPKKIVKMVPGYRNAVKKVLSFQSVPRNVLKIMEELYLRREEKIISD